MGDSIAVFVKVVEAGSFAEAARLLKLPLPSRRGRQGCQQQMPTAYGQAKIFH
jgi:hypothetical protein